MKKVEDYVITIPDFPEPGIMFRDVTGILRDGEGLQLAVQEILKRVDPDEYDAVAALEARGFLFGMPISVRDSKPMIMIRKKGKLPRETVSKSYALEYGTAEIEVHKEDVKPGMRIVLVDDLIATGGSARAAAELLEELGAKVVKCVFLMELKGLNGRETLAGWPVESVIEYEGK